MGKEITTEKALDLFEKIIEIKTENKMLIEIISKHEKEIERLKGCLSDKEGLIYSMGEEISKLKEVPFANVILSRFDKEIENVESIVTWGLEVDKLRFDTIKKTLREAISCQKISGV